MDKDIFDFFNTDLQFIVDATGSTFDLEKGVLTLVLNGKSFEIPGFSTCDCEKIWEKI